MDPLSISSVPDIQAFTHARTLFEHMLMRMLYVSAGLLIVGGIIVAVVLIRRRSARPRAGESAPVQDPRLATAGLAPVERPAAARPWDMSVETFTCCMHLAQYLGVVIPLFGYALVITMWLMCRKQDVRIEAQGRVVLNWIFSHIIYSLICFLLIFVIIGIPLLIVLGFCGLIFPIIGAVNAADNVVWRYPGSIPFLSVPDPEAEGKTKFKPAAHAWMDQIGRPR